MPSLSAIYREHFAYVWAVLRRLGVPEADLEDLVQEVFVVAHRRLDTFEHRSSIRTWLYGIAVRLHLNDARRRQRRGVKAEVSGSAIPVLDERLDPEVHTARGQARRILADLLDNLDDDKRVVFVLSELEGLPAPAIARITGANTRTVYSRLRAARDRFSADLARVHARERNGITVRSLLRQGRRPERPSAGVQRRIYGALVLRLGLPSTAASTAGGWVMGLKAAGASFGLGIATLGVIVSVGKATAEPRGTSTSARRAVIDSASAEPRPSTPASKPAAVALEVEPPDELRAVAPSPGLTRRHERGSPSSEPAPSDALAEELDLMGRAREALRRSDPGRALELLDEHALKFPEGALTQERRRSRLTALCAAGRYAEAGPLAEQLGQPGCEAASITKAGT